MKTLVTVSFAIELSEDELLGFVQKMDQSIFESIKAQVDSLDVSADEIDKTELDEIIDWYGASFTPRRDLLEGIIE